MEKSELNLFFSLKFFIVKEIKYCFLKELSNFKVEKKHYGFKIFLRDDLIIHLKKNKIKVLKKTYLSTNNTFPYDVFKFFLDDSDMEYINISFNEVQSICISKTEKSKPQY